MAKSTIMLKRLFQSLSFKLGFTIGLILLLTVLGYAYFLLKTQEAQAIQKILTTASWFSNTLKRSTKYSMMKYQQESVHRIIEAVGDQKGVEAIRIFNKKGTVMYSSQSREIGHTVNLHAEACFSCHQKDQPLEKLPISARSRIFTTQGKGRVLAFINPIYNEMDCSMAPCHAHPPDRTVLGVLDVVLSLKEVDQELKESSKNTIVFAFFFFLGAFGLLGSCIYYFINRPISQLRLRTGEIARGEFNRPIEAHSGDEIGDLARAFENMRGKILEMTMALKKSREEYQTLFESVPCYISVQDRNLRLARMNKDFRKDFGGKRGAYCFEVYKGRQEKCPDCIVEKTFQTGKIYSREEIVFPKGRGKAHMLVFTAPIYNEKNEIISVMEMSTNITEIKVLEEELIKSEEAYRILFNNDPSPIFVVGQATFKILDANDRAQDLHGFSKKELTQKTFLELLSLEEREEFLSSLKGNRNFIPKLKQIRKDGSIIYVNLRYSKGVYRDISVYILTTNDITERMQTEQQLIQASKMATLGEMSAGIAHELNQPLTVIKTASSFILRKKKEKEKISDGVLSTLAKEMDEQVDRASRIINHLREFGRKTEIRMVKTQVNEVIRGMLTVMGKQLELRQIQVLLDLDPDLPPIWGDKNRLEQVFINLAMNARDALEDPDIPEKCITIRSVYKKDWVKITFSDTGGGIPEEIRGKIFEPFFSTKGVGQGTGLGLSISYGIIRDYQGHIEVESTVGKGTTFHIHFPPYLEKDKNNE